MRVPFFLIGFVTKLKNCVVILLSILSHQAAKSLDRSTKVDVCTKRSIQWEHLSTVFWWNTTPLKCAFSFKPGICGTLSFLMIWCIVCFMSTVLQANEGVGHITRKTAWTESAFERMVLFYLEFLLTIVLQSANSKREISPNISFCRKYDKISEGHFTPELVGP